MLLQDGMASVENWFTLLKKDLSDFAERNTEETGPSHCLIQQALQFFFIDDNYAAAFDIHQFFCFKVT